MPKLVAVVGSKHSGKTTIIEHLIAELSKQGFRVGVVKEMVTIATLDTPQKETDRYAQTGAQKIIAVPRQETVIFIKKQLSLKEISPYLQELDYVLLEGFEHEPAIPRIIAAKTVEDAKSYLNQSTIAFSGLIADLPEKINLAPFGFPILSSLTEATELADLVQQKAALLI